MDPPEYPVSATLWAGSANERLTVPSHLEKGKPSSRAKANIWRELDASALMVIITKRTSTMLTKPVVPPTLLVAFWNT